MKLYAFRHNRTGVLAALYHISHELYLVDGDDSDGPTFVGNSMEEMEAIFDETHEYIIMDICKSDYQIIEFEFKTQLTKGHCVGTY